MSLATSVRAMPAGTGVHYAGRPGLFKLLLKNLGLTWVTLGIYRFWAKTHVRRYFWSNVEIDGEPLEYAGAGRELFIGFLIVLAFLAPLGIVWGAVQSLLTSELAVGIAQAVYLLVILLLIQAAMFRARRYRLSRTLWRGVRAGQDGSTWRYVGLASLWWVASLLSLGLAAPWGMVAVQRYLMRNTRFGETYFSFDASGMKLFPAWLLVLAALAVPALGIGAVAGLAVTEGEPGEGFVIAALAPLLSILCGAVAYAWFRVRRFRYFAACARLGETQFQAQPRFGAVLLRFVLFSLTTLTIFGVIVGGSVLGKSAAGAVAGGVAIGTIAAVVVGYVIVAPLFTLMVHAPILRHLCETLTIRNLDSASLIRQSSAPVQKYGEGLADSFEFGVA